MKNKQFLPESQLSEILDIIKNEDVEKFIELLEDDTIHPDMQISCVDSIYDGNFLIHIIVMSESCVLLIIILMRGADVNLLNKHRESALLLACRYGYLSCVKWLISYYADINKIHDHTLECDTSLHMAVSCYGLSEFSSCYLEIIKYLIENGANVNSVNSRGFTPLHIAVCKRDTIVTELLIDHGSMLDSSQTISPLMRSIESQSYCNFRYLLSKGSNVNSYSESFPSVTPLSGAVLRNNLIMVLDLLAARADPNLSFNSSPMYHAAENNYLLMLYCLLVSGGNANMKSGIDKAPLILTMTRRQSQLGCQMLIKFNADLNLDNKLGTTPLWEAVKSNNIDLICLFLEEICLVDALSLEYFLYKPISSVELAIMQHKFEIIKMLLFAGAHLRIMWLASIKTDPNWSQLDVSWLYSWLHNVHPLKLLCRINLRRRYQNKLKYISRKIIYPSFLKEYILSSIVH